MGTKEKCTSCICPIIKDILKTQNQASPSRNCAVASCNQLLNPNEELKDTIPIILYGKYNNEPFEAIGDCFCTIFFRINKVNDNCCATLEMLEPYECYGCKKPLPKLFPTGICLTVDLNSFSGVQCLQSFNREERERKEK
ncbi:CotY/CotZ family spore coat protein [Halalkalibacillus halophilus]|uniref:CotY/CotZ family spore coat protein n=1 Tax=Halalkalibacillus halophilus TaxID=392827 RepID=UPI0004885E01|nr:CotY/CotZ family spore coat protein [Halalkalibacillus halophilus]